MVENSRSLTVYLKLRVEMAKFTFIYLFIYLFIHSFIYLFSTSLSKLEGRNDQVYLLPAY